MPPTAMRAIIAALENVGPMTAAELRIFLKRSFSAVYRPLTTLRTRKIVRITSYQVQEGKGGRHAPVYALGSEPDAIEPPRATVSARNKTYSKRHSAILAVRRRVRRGAPTETNPWQGLMR